MPPPASLARPEAPRTSRHRRFSTSTVLADGTLVPWLAASGELSYTPEAPPPRDYYFQYGWVLKDVCTPEARRWHLYFGVPYKERPRNLFDFWALCRRGAVDRDLYHAGKLDGARGDAPIAVYRHRSRIGEDRYLLIQHGSYQSIPVEEQPFMEEGMVVLHRGLGKAGVFRFPGPPSDASEAEHEPQWERYLRLQHEILSRSDVSFNSIHDRAKRSETEHINDRSWMTDALAAERGIDIEHDAELKALWSAAHQSFALRQWVGERKFGPSRVVCRTPIGNIRITSFFAREHEARIIDPARVEVIESVACEVERRPLWSQTRIPASRSCVPASRQRPGILAVS